MLWLGALPSAALKPQPPPPDPAIEQDRFGSAIFGVLGAAAFGLLAILVGFFGAYTLYSKAAIDPLPARLGGVSRTIRNRFYFDEIYQATIIRLHEFLAAVAAWFDRWIIAGLAVRGTHGTTELVGRALRELEGNLKS